MLLFTIVQSAFESSSYWSEAPYLACIHTSKRRASEVFVSMLEGIQVPHQLDHSGAYHQDVKDRMGAPQVEFAGPPTFRKPGLRAAYVRFDPYVVWETRELTA